MQVICKLPNAARRINGVAFSDHPSGGLISDPIDTRTAEQFLRVPGYEAVPEIDVPVPAEASKRSRPTQPRAQDE